MTALRSQNEFWVQEFCHPHNGESTACLCASEDTESGGGGGGMSAVSFSVLGPHTFTLALLCSSSACPTFVSMGGGLRQASSASRDLVLGVGRVSVLRC